MKNKNWIKQQLADGKTVKGMWCELGSPALAEAAVYAGWPVILVDNEHGTASLETTVHMVRAIEAAGGHVIVRVPWNDQVYLKRILDLGVRSLMIPMICDEASARAAVDGCYYPPSGQRGYAAPIVRASQYGVNADYMKQANDDLLLIAQIEHVDAIANIAKIAAVDGIDMLFIGPNDMAGSVGKLERLGDKDVSSLFDETEAAMRDAAIAMGTIPRPDASFKDLTERGHSLIIGPADIALFTEAASKMAKEWDNV